MKKILIAGANGYIGERLSVYLAKSGYLVTGLCFPSIPDLLSRSSYFEELHVVDLRESNLIDKLTDNYYDVFVNLVSLDQYQSEGDAKHVVLTNVAPSLNLLKHFSNKHTLKKYIYFSSIQVYGDLFLENITEEKYPKPQNVYGLTHSLSENICNYYHNTSIIDCINIRLSNSYGSPILASDNCWGLAVNDLCKSAHFNHKIALKSNGSAQRDFIHGFDICNAIKYLVMLKEKLPNNIYNISTGKTITILELAIKIRKIFYSRYKIWIPIIFPDGQYFESLNLYVKKRFRIDNSKMCALGFTPKISVEDGINELFIYFDKLNGK